MDLPRATDDGDGRTARKRRAIMQAATDVFLEHGYLGASMDEVATRAGVSKQTVYKQFHGKEHLFTEIILGTTNQVVGGFVRAYANTLDQATDTDIDTAFRDLSRRFLDNLMQPDVLRLRRLVVAEADRFPEISGAWFQDAFHRSVILLGEAMTRLADRGLLRQLDDPTLAAYHFAGLLMYKPMNQVMFAGSHAKPDPEELTVIADQAAAVFLAAYGTTAADTR